MKRDLLKAAVAIVVMGLAVLMSGFAPDDWEDERFKFQEQFSADLGGVDTLNIVIINGGIKLQINEGGALAIEVEEEVRAPDAAEAEDIADEIKLKARRDGSTLYIEIDYGRYEDMIRQGWGKEYGYSGSLTVSLPSRLALDLMTTNGGIKIPRMGAEVKARTTNGGIKLEGCRGPATLSTTNGGIDAGVVVGYLEAHTTNGGISGTITGALMGDVEMETTNGAITLGVDPSSSFKLDAQTFNGKVYSDFGYDREEDRYRKRRTSVHTTIAGGQHKVSLQTMNGSIKVEKIR